jgi:hypothetical protein
MKRVQGKVQDDNTLAFPSPLFGKEGIGEILRITKSPILFQEHPMYSQIPFVVTQHCSL